MKITATIITLNEERNVARAVESLRCYGRNPDRG